MSQVFHRSTNTLSRVSIFGFLFFVAAMGWFVQEINRSSYVTEAYVARTQPVPFSHKHHVDGMGLDCRYCHVNVEETSFAGIPPTKTCMNCHSQIWSQAPMLEPVRASFRTDQSIEWIRVHDLPDYVYFNHSIHVTKGIGCSTCHGQVDQMPLMWRVNTLQMEWCLNCHRQPEKYLRPPERAFDMKWSEPSKEHPVDWNGVNYTEQLALGAAVAKKYDVKMKTYCSACHR
jgi:hypothetical protein